LVTVDRRGRIDDCEAVAVPAAADRLLPVRAITSPSPFDGEPTIAVLGVKLGEGKGLMVACDEHTDYHRLQRAGWSHPLHVGVMAVAGCSVLGIEWDQGDHSIRHRGERRFGQVYAVTAKRGDGGGTALRWTIPPYDPERG
jgi:hypothetical protein